MKKKNRILYIISTLERCGPVNMLFNILKYLDRDKFEPFILTLSKEPHNTRIDDFINLKINVSSLSLNRIDMELWGKDRLVSVVNDISPDIIHTHGIRADKYAIKYLYNYNHCNTIHNYPYYDYTMAYGKVKGRIIAFYHTNIFKKVDYPISCSFFVSDKLKENHKIITHTIQNGIDNEFFFPIDLNEKLVLRQKLGLPLEKKIFVYAGILSRRKDPLTIIKSYNKANIDRDAVLLILGDGPLREKCDNYKNESIVFKGFVNNPLDYLRSSDVFISASIAEGLPIAVLEAMGVGLPVLLSDIEPHREIIENTDAGELFHVGDVEKLSELLKNYSKIDLISKSKKAVDIISKNYNAKLMSEKYMKMYDFIINNNKNQIER